MSRLIIRRINVANNIYSNHNGKIALNTIRKFGLNSAGFDFSQNRKVVQQTRCASGVATGIIKSPLGPCPKIPNENFLEYVFKKMDGWVEEPAAVSNKKCNRPITDQTFPDGQTVDSDCLR